MDTRYFISNFLIVVRIASSTWFLFVNTEDFNKPDNNPYTNCFLRAIPEIISLSFALPSQGRAVLQLRPIFTGIALVNSYLKGLKFGNKIRFFVVFPPPLKSVFFTDFVPLKPKGLVNFLKSLSLLGYNGYSIVDLYGRKQNVEMLNLIFTSPPLYL